jgi:hypothetical protein
MSVHGSGVSEGVLLLTNCSDHEAAAARNLLSSRRRARSDGGVERCRTPFAHREVSSRPPCCSSGDPPAHTHHMLQLGE